MQNKYSGTKTEENLRKAFAGEAMARDRYTYYADVAKKEGYEQIADIFLKTADNEKEHGELWFKALGELGKGGRCRRFSGAGCSVQRCCCNRETP